MAAVNRGRGVSTPVGPPHPCCSFPLLVQLQSLFAESRSSFSSKGSVVWLPRAPAFGCLRSCGLSSDTAGFHILEFGGEQALNEGRTSELCVLYVSLFVVDSVLF